MLIIHIQGVTIKPLLNLSTFPDFASRKSSCHRSHYIVRLVKNHLIATSATADPCIGMRYRKYAFEATELTVALIHKSGMDGASFRQLMNTGVHLCRGPKSSCWIAQSISSRLSVPRCLLLMNPICASLNRSGMKVTMLAHHSNCTAHLELLYLRSAACTHFTLPPMVDSRPKS